MVAEGAAETVQPLPQVSAVTGARVTAAFRLMASLRAITIAVIRSCEADFTLCPAMKFRNDGTPTPSMTAMMVTVTIISISVKPRCVAFTVISSIPPRSTYR